MAAWENFRGAFPMGFNGGFRGALAMGFAGGLCAALRAVFDVFSVTGFAALHAQVVNASRAAQHTAHRIIIRSAPQALYSIARIIIRRAAKVQQIVVSAGKALTFNLLQHPELSRHLYIVNPPLYGLYCPTSFPWRASRSMTVSFTLAPVKWYR